MPYATRVSRTRRFPLYTLELVTRMIEEMMQMQMLF